ncbi:hypothetical protein BDV93DRAFT_285726 [Ceratobasidium sp. AG-I]|nr:hypothetical protein BDV93DRAFT_285726 [Ceratobasidium sp. AG-I]
MPTFQPIHAQPFTFDQACQLDSPTISAARLQHSLGALASTQKQLQEAINEDDHPDPDLVLAFQENSSVVASQEERIVMLRKALEAQGAAIADNPHYEVQQGPPPASSGISPQEAASALQPNNPPSQSDAHEAESSGGIYL